MSRSRRASFVVRVAKDRRGRVSGIVELVATGAKEAFTGAEAIGPVIEQMLPGAVPKRGRPMVKADPPGRCGAMPNANSRKGT